MRIFIIIWFTGVFFLGFLHKRETILTHPEHKPNKTLQVAQILFIFVSRTSTVSFLMLNCHCVLLYKCMVAKFIRFRHPCLGDWCLPPLLMTPYPDWISYNQGICNATCLSSKGPDRTRFVFVGALILISLAGSRPKPWPTFHIHHVLVNLQYHALLQQVWSIYVHILCICFNKHISIYTHCEQGVLTLLPHIHQSSSHGHNVYHNVVIERYG